MRVGSLLQRLLLLSSTVLLATAPSGCLGCGGGSEPAAAEALRQQFPDRAAAVLEGNEVFAVSADGSAWVAPEAGRGVSAELPRDGAAAIRLRVAGGFEVRVREIGVEGEGALTERAIAYRRAGGTSFWTATPGGIEEWLHLEASAARRDGVAAAWEVLGATLRKHGDAIELVDENGVVRLSVTAPAAYAAGGSSAAVPALPPLALPPLALPPPALGLSSSLRGRPVEARLEVRGTRIELSVDGGGDAVLVDPMWTPVASMGTSRYWHRWALLSSGKVLVAGGYNSAALASAEI